MKFFFTPLLVVIISITVVMGQARIVFNGNPYMVIRNSAYVVQANPAANGISGTGRIISESETNRLRWMIGTSTGTYVVPFGSSAGSNIPHSITIGTAGAGAGSYIDFSTYKTPTFMNTAWASGVTHLTDNFLNPNHTYVLDRWWITNPVNYTTKPSLSGMLFTYDDIEWTQAGNTISEANLAAQRFNTTSNVWLDMAPVGTVNTVANTVTISTTITPANFYRPWVLVDRLHPLPVTLSEFSVTCISGNGNAFVKWTTQTELNNDYFIIEKSIDGINFEQVGIIDGAGTSYNKIDYSFTDDSPYAGVSYYRLKQVDFNLQQATSEIKTFTNCKNTTNQNITVFNNGDKNVLQIQSETESNFVIQLYDVTGKLVNTENVFVNKGVNTFVLNSGYSPGIYLINVFNNNTQYHKKITINNQ